MTDIITPEEVERLANEHNSAALSLDSGDHTVVERLFRAGEMLRYRAIPMAALIATQAAEIERLRSKLEYINALDPEWQGIESLSFEAAKGLVLRMGEMARAALEQEGG